MRVITKKGLPHPQTMPEEGGWKGFPEELMLSRVSHGWMKTGEGTVLYSEETAWDRGGVLLTPQRESLRRSSTDPAKPGSLWVRDGCY